MFFSSLSLSLLILFSSFPSQAGTPESPWIDSVTAEQSVYPYSLPSSEDVDEAKLTDFVQKTVDSGSDSLIVIKNGRIIVEKYFGNPIQVETVQSVTKSISSLLIGILLGEGKIPSLDEPLSTWYPTWKTSPDKSKVTLRMILTHTSGVVDDDSLGDQANIVDYLLAKPLASAPGTQFVYSSGAISLLSPIILQASGLTADELLKEKIFAPLGIENYHWNSDLAGNFKMGGGLFMQPIDMAKIGTLMLHKGVWANQSLVSSAWTQLSVQSSQSLTPSYGLLWWLYGLDPLAKKYSGFSACGYGGQFVTVYPSQDLIAVRTRHLDDNDTPAEFDIVSFGAFPDLVGGLSDSK